MAAPTIVGIMLVKDEDCFVAQAVRNVIGFCDLLLVADHGSRDRTPAILEALAGQHPNLRLHRIQDAAESHRLIEGYAGTDTWVFGVDGDELYDPAGLAVMRGRILAGEYQDYWCLYGHVLHCTTLDPELGTARGYLAPPALSMTKLYNFSRLTDWRGCPQRLHWGQMNFAGPKPRSLRLCDEGPWDQGAFRCLHTVFLRRSSLQEKFSSLRNTRFNPSELRRNSGLDWAMGIKHVLKQIFVYPITRLPWFDYKHRIYRKGRAVTVDAAPFL